jgi:sulfite reductase (NADPH) hemoprotein beta-component
MYRATDFDRRFLKSRAAQFRDQLERHLRGELAADDFRPLRLQNGWYVQRHAPMLRVAIPYGELSARQLRTLAAIAREYDRPAAPQLDLGLPPGGYGHFTTRQNLQYNGIALKDAADVMDRLAEVDMHGIQTSGNCIRNITSDALAGIAPDEFVDPRPYCELLRQWSTLHPEFAFLPRKFKIAVHGAAEDRVAGDWHDIHLVARRNAQGVVGFEVRAGGGMGRTPILARRFAEWVRWDHLPLFIEALVRAYNLAGRRDNAYKARLKILVKAEGESFVQAVRKEYDALLADPVSRPFTQAELDRVAAGFVDPVNGPAAEPDDDVLASWPAATAFTRWLDRNVHAHRVAGYRAVTLSLKRAGFAPGDATAEQMEAAAELAERFSLAELRVTHEQNLLLPWVRASELPALWQAARAAGFANPTVGLIGDLIACPGGDLCALANARTTPLARQLLERFADLDEQHDIGDLALHMSGCINSCGHHHSGHIGVLGVDKDGTEWYQISLGGSDGSERGATPHQASTGRILGPAFAADELVDAVSALITLYLADRLPGERFVHTAARVPMPVWRAAADAVRHTETAALAG